MVRVDLLTCCRLRVMEKASLALSIFIFPSTFANGDDGRHLRRRVITIFRPFFSLATHVED